MSQAITLTILLIDAFDGMIPFPHYVDATVSRTISSINSELAARNRKPRGQGASVPWNL
jgi:hypothetical protein